MSNNIKNGSNKLMVFFCVPGMFVKSVRVFCNSKISCLMDTVQKNNDYTYVFNGNIINSDLTFNEIGISNGNVIVAFKKENEKSFNNDIQWIKLANDASFESNLFYLSNKKMKAEYYRLRDIKNMKIEGSAKLYRKTTQKYFLKNSKELENSMNNVLEINYEPSSMPCTEAMPNLW